jgi:hypothetical protein
MELTDRISPLLGFTRSGPGQRPEVTDAELVCSALARRDQAVGCRKAVHREWRECRDAAARVRQRWRARM